MTGERAERNDESPVALFDVDNTLLDNDRVQQDLREQLAREFGAGARDRYWEILERLREELGYVDYLGALERYRLERLHDPRVLALSGWLVDYPFADNPVRRAVRQQRAGLRQGQRTGFSNALGRAGYQGDLACQAE